MKKVMILCIGIVMLVFSIMYINRICDNVEKTYKNIDILRLEGRRIICNIDNNKMTYRTKGKVHGTYKNIQGDIHIKNNKVVKVKIKVPKKIADSEKDIKKEKNVTPNIRVVLKTSGYKGIKHKKVILESERDLVLEYGSNKKKINEDKLCITSKSKYFDKSKKIRICVNDNTTKQKKKNSIEDSKKKNNQKEYYDDEKNGIKIKSIKRGAPNLKYYGVIELIKEGDSIIIVNDIDIERYLYAVVPSEMPQHFGLEALKVQAICARTYAYIHRENTTYKKYNANIDDSISYQVYNNQISSDITKAAVDSTKGQILIYKNKLAKVFYYSTSCGYSSKTKDVFGGENIPYIISKKQCISSSNKTKIDNKIKLGDKTKKKNSSDNEKNNDMTKEKNFKKFILSTGGECFEKNCEWFRWKIKWNVNKITSAVNANLKTLANNKSHKDICLYKNKKYKSVPIKNIGIIKDIKVTKRGEGGVVKQIIITTSTKKIRVNSQNTIRKILGPINITITKHNKTKVQTMETLPSAYFIITSNKNNITITGGGFGHGVGMSQYGVQQLTKQNMSHKQILQYYFPKVKISKAY